MKTRSFVVFVMAFAGMAAYGEPIELGCSARGPLAALASSAAFREAIGGANPANYLGSVYDVNGQQLSPSSFKTLQCPLFIDSDAEPSASASKAILRAESGVQAAKPVEQAVVSPAGGSVVISSSTGVIAQIPQPELQNTGAQEPAAAATQAESHRARHNSLSAAVLKPAPAKEEVTAAVAKLQPEAAPRPEAAPVAKRAEQAKKPGNSDVQSEESMMLSFAQTLGLTRQVEVKSGVVLWEVNGLVMLVYFFATFLFVLGISLLVCRPRVPVTVARSGLDLRRAAIARMDPLDRSAARSADISDLKRQSRIPVIPRRTQATWASGD